VTGRLETAADDQNRCGEAPIWDCEQGRLLWSDIESSIVYELLASGERRVLSRGLKAAGIALNRGGALVLAGAGGLHLWSGPDRCCMVVSSFAGEALILNDILADPRGRIYAGTLYWGPAGMEQLGALYLIDTGSSARVVDDGIELANGLGLSPDNRTLYFADSAARAIYAYEVEPESGALAKKRVFARVPAGEGLPDGLTVDGEGHVWSAQWYGAQVVRYDPEGRIERRIPLPVKQVSSVAFGGKDLTDLYITTARDPWRSPLAPAGYDFDAPDTGGALYRLRLEVQGKPEHRSGFRAS
jgi:D-xylonolactonase